VAEDAGMELVDAADDGAGDLVRRQAPFEGLWRHNDGLQACLMLGSAYCSPVSLL